LKNESILSNSLLGGFAHVYVVRTATPINNTTQHVLKRIAVSDEAMLNEVKKEVDIMVGRLTISCGYGLMRESSADPARSPEHRESHRRVVACITKWNVRGIYIDGTLLRYGSAWLSRMRVSDVEQAEVSST
jgi:hypothetical protein